MKFCKKIQHSIDEAHSLYWVRTGLHGLRLGAISYTFENGTCRTVKLAEFDMKEELNAALRLHFELCKVVRKDLAPDILPSLENAWWQGELPKPGSVILREFEDGQREPEEFPVYYDAQGNEHSEF